MARAAREAGVSRTAAYMARESDPGFAQAWDDVIEAAVDELESVAFKRSLEGSDYLLRILLSAHRPGKYRERSSVEHSGPGGGPLSVTVTDLARFADGDDTEA